MAAAVTIAGRPVGHEHPVYIVAEIGINHNGDLDTARRLIDVAAAAGSDAVKFQKRTPEICVPPALRSQLRETPWGLTTYLEYRERMEFGEQEYREIDRHCRTRGIPWFASAWDEPSVDFLERFDPPCHKIPSAALTDADLLRRFRATGRPLILSTGMSSLEELRAAVRLLGTADLIMLHCNSTYPCPPEELNLRTIETLRREFDCPVGYSGHEVGLVTTVGAVVLGACLVERHITLDRAMWGSDQAASVEPQGLQRLVKYIRVMESALGDGVKKVTTAERTSIARLRRQNTLDLQAPEGVVGGPPAPRGE